MKKNLIILTSVILACLVLSGCGAKVKNGDDAVASFKEVDGISATELYKMYKEKYGAEDLVNMIDTKLLAKEFENDNSKDEEVYVNQSIESIKEQAGDNYEQYIKQYYNMDNEEDLKEYLRLNYKRNKWISDYVTEKVSDKEVQTYYDEKTVGDMELSHILIAPDVKSDASDADKTAAEKTAKEKAESIIKELDNGADFSELAKKYSSDESNKDKGGSLGYINREGYDENFIEGAISLKKGTYSKEPVKSSYGYHIIKKTNQKSKPKLEKVKEDIKKTIAEEKLTTDKTLSVKAIEALREKYGMKINDSELQKSYKKIIDNMYSQANGNTNTQESAN